MQSSEIRRRFLDFFGARGHRFYPSSSLIPHNDPTVLLTTAGMQQFITYFTGEDKPPAPRAVIRQTGGGAVPFGPQRRADDGAPRHEGELHERLRQDRRRGHRLGEDRRR